MAPLYYGARPTASPRRDIRDESLLALGIISRPVDSRHDVLGVDVSSADVVEVASITLADDRNNAAELRISRDHVAD